MSLSVNDLAELMEMWEELNFTSSSANHDNHRHPGNLTHAVEVCPARFSQGALFYTLSVLYLFIFLVGLAANALVVWVSVRSERGRRYETHLYVLNLSVADLCVTATLPVWVSSLLQRGHWPFGQAVCQATHLVFSVNLFASIFFLTCMSVDRYLSSRARYGEGVGSRRKKVIRRAVCVAVWVVALAASLPDTYFLQAVRSSHSDSITVCRSVYPGPEPRDWMVGVQLSFIILGFLVPFPVLAVSYLLLARSILPLQEQQEEEEEQQERERRLSRNILLSYIVVFLLCWLPYHAALLLDTLALLNALPFSCSLENLLYVALHLTQCLSLLHCCLNPLLYTFLSRSYRYDLMKAFIFKYSTRTGLARLIDGTSSARASEETEYEEVESHAPL